MAGFVFYAFPGMGKTPAAKRMENTIDLDFGHYRAAHQVKKRDEARLYPSYIRLVQKYLDEGWNVFSNCPHVIGSFPGYREAVYLPRDPKWGSRKLGVDEDTIQEWVQDWVAIATKAKVPVHTIDVDLIHYLVPRSKRSD